MLVSCVTCVSGSALPWIEAELGYMPGPSTADASEMMFSVESLVFGAGDWILLFSGAKHSFTGARSIKTTLWFARAASFLESWSCFYFLCLFCPSLPAQRRTRSLLSQLSLTCCGAVSWSLCRAPWDTRNPLEELMLQHVDVRHGLAALNLKWYVAAYQSILASGHSILTWFIFNSKKPLNQVIVTCLHMPLLFLWVLVLYFFSHASRVFGTCQGNFE